MNGRLVALVWLGNSIVFDIAEEALLPLSPLARISSGSFLLSILWDKIKHTSISPHGSPFAISLSFRSRREVDLTRSWRTSWGNLWAGHRMIVLELQGRSTPYRPGWGCRERTDETCVIGASPSPSPHSLFVMRDRRKIGNMTGTEYKRVRMCRNIISEGMGRPVARPPRWDFARVGNGLSGLPSRMVRPALAVSLVAPDFMLSPFSSCVSLPASE